MSTLLTKIAADFTTQLATAISVGGTTATLLSQTDDDGVTLPDGNYTFTLDGASSNKEHIRCVKTGTALTSIQSVSRQGALTTGVVRAHRIGCSVVITDWAQLKYLTDLLSGATNLDSSDPLEYDGTASITNSNQLATKAYADGLAIAGAPDSSTTVKGIVKMSTAPVSATAPIAVGDNDTRVPTQDENDALAGTSGTPSSSNKYVTNNDTATASTADKVARRLATGGITVPTIPTNSTDAASKAYVDQLSPLVSQQQINISNTGNSVPAVTCRVTSESDGSVIYTVGIASAGSTGANLTRLARDVNTGMYYITHTASISTADFSAFTSDTAISIAVVGSFIYVAYCSGGSARIKRLSSADLTGATDMTVSGTQFSTSVINAFGGGSDLYVFTSANTYNKYTISGTTATFSSAITYTSGGTSYGAISNGTSVWLMTSNVFRKYAIAGGAASTSLTTLADQYNSAYNTPGFTSLVIPKTGYLAYVQPYSTVSATTTLGVSITISPITAI